MAPAAAPCSRRFSDSPCSIEGSCMVFPFARHVSERGQRTPGQVPVQQIELKAERVAIAYRLLFAYALIGSESEQNSSHSLSRVGFAAIALAATRAARHITGRGPPRDVARREPKQRHQWDSLVVLHD